jgi:magnesium transporter
MAEPASEAWNERSETAAQHLVTRVPTAAPDESAGALLARLAGQRFDCAEGICLVGPAGELVGLVPLTRLLAAAPDAKLADLALRPPPAAAPEADQETVASLAIRHGVAALPVVDGAGRLLGVVPPQALLEVLRHEHVEDLHRLAGIRRESMQARVALEAPPLRRVRDRLPWLLAGLAGSSVAALLVARFEETLRSRLALAFFVPGIVYLADAIGTQTEAIAVRGLSLSHAPIQRLLLGELRTGILLGVVLGALSALPIWLWLGDLRLALAVGLALLGAGAVATTIGFAFPWLLARLGRDPAFGSGPLATVIQDVLSLAIYFATVSWIAS